MNLSKEQINRLKARYGLGFDIEVLNFDDQEVLSICVFDKNTKNATKFMNELLNNEYTFDIKESNEKECIDFLYFTNFKKVNK